MTGMLRQGFDGAGGGTARRCPSRGEWRARLAHRFNAELAEPESWREDLAHLDVCGSCREITLELEPTLLFRSLAAPEPSLDASTEAASMLQAVTALRRAERVEGLERRSGTVLRWADLAKAPWSRWAAAAVVALTALSLGAVTRTDDPRTTSVLSRAASPQGEVHERSGGEEGYREEVDREWRYGEKAYGEIAGITTIGTEIPPGLLVPNRLDPLGSVVEDTLDTLPLIEPFETDSYGTDIYGTGVGEDPVIWQTEKTALIWMVDSGGHEGDLQGV